MSTSPSLANSDGCNAKPPPSMIHECDPLTVEPSGVTTTTSPTSVAR